MAYVGYITTLKNVRPHGNADRLQLGDCFGNTVCVNLDYYEGQVGLYLPVDGQLSEEFAKNNNLLRLKDENGHSIPGGGYMDPKKRNVVAIKLRGERSDGLFLPLSCLDYCFGKGDAAANHLSVGDTVDVVNGHEICKKYIPPVNVVDYNKKKSGSKLKKKGLLVSLFGDKEVELPQFEEHIDTPQLRFCQDMFKPGDIICLTEKVHGTSSRNANTLSIPKNKGFFKKLFNIKNEKYQYVVGTRRTVVANEAGGYYGTNQFRIDWGEKFKGKLNPGEEVFGEIAGWIDENTPIMGVANNKKTNDKDFIKKYGDTTTFTYGCEKGKSRFFIYRMTYTSPEGYTIEYHWDLVKLRAEQMGFEVVPELDRFIYTTEEDFNNRIQRWMDISSTIDPTHIIEGVVIRALNSPTFKVAKEKSFLFKVIEGIIKNDAENPDIEEMEEILEKI